MGITQRDGRDRMMLKWAAWARRDNSRLSAHFLRFVSVSVPGESSLSLPLRHLSSTVPPTFRWQQTNRVRRSGPED